MQTPTSQEPLRIVELHIENVKRLTAAHIVPQGSTVVLGGKNAQGKSSVLDAIEMALTGKICARPIHDGADKGKVVADLGEIIVTRTFTKAGGGTLTVAARNGAKFSSPQTMLNELYGKIAFDPLEFTRMKPADQLNTLRQIVGINTAMIDTARQAAFDERTTVNRKVKELEAQIAGMPHHPEAPAEEVSASAINAQIQEANKYNEHRERFILRGKQEAESLAQLDAQIADLEAKLVEMKADSERRHIALDNMRAEGKHMAAPIDTAPLLAQMDSIAATNRKVYENTLRADAEQALAKWTQKSVELTSKIEALDIRKRQKLEHAQYPVPGLRLTDDGIEFNGVPFDQASAAEQLRVSVAIGIAANPRLRVMLVRDAALLDEDSLSMLEQMAEETGSQVWVERVGKGDECHVIIEDGRVSDQ